MTKDFAKILLIISLLLVHIQCASNARFDKYISTFGKKYKDINEYNFRLKIYNFNLLQISEHNSNPEVTYDLAHSIYSDMTDQDFVSTILADGGKYLDEYSKIPLTTGGIAKPTSILVNVPSCSSEINWKNKKLVSAIKSQGICGNGYVFGAVAAAESALMVQAPILKISYSEQQVMDCCKSEVGYSCNGCLGGSMLSVFEYIAKSGITTSSQYPYSSDSGKTGKCLNNVNVDKIASSGAYKRIAPQNLSALYNQLSKQPIAVLVDASNWAQYKGGVFQNCSSSMSDNNHAALLVGYDEKGNWIVKNSWGQSWGQSGYITLSPGNTCGISNYAVTFNIDSII